MQPIDFKLLIAGVDEAGRGPLAGPVFAAAVILDPNKPIVGLVDSKKISAKKRTELSIEIKNKALAWHISFSTVAEIDKINILQASLDAMRKACINLKIQPDLILVDGNRLPANLPANAKAIIKGDQTEPAISAASILAKTARDIYCLEMHQIYPQYAFDQHKGYGTVLHKARLIEFGPCPEHRRSFAPVKELL